MKPRLWIGLWVVALVSLVGCYTVPETGRSAFNFVPESIASEQAASAFAQLKQEGKVSSDSTKIARVRNVGVRIVRIAHAPDFPPAENWEFVVFDDDKTINAFAMPGGKVGVYTGLLNLTASDDELAAVIGHEIAHVSARHGSERMSEALTIAAGGVAVGYAVRNKSDQTQAAILAAYGAGATVGCELPFSRMHESEADRIGMLYMARAGYDPRAAISFWQKMKAKSSGASTPELLSTHPSDDTRIRQLQEYLPIAMQEYARTTGKQ